MYTDNDFIRLDWATKYVLRDKADFEVFEGLMTVLFGEPVKIIELFPYSCILYFLISL